MTSGDVLESNVPAPIRLLPAPRDARQYAPDVIERCYHLWRMSAGSLRAAARRYADEVPDGAPVPAHQTLSDWARDYGWDARWTAEYERDQGRDIYAIERRATQLIQEHLSIMAEAQAGAFDNNPAAGIVRLKPGELLGRLLEKRVLHLAPSPPATTDLSDGAGPDWETMTQAERETWARQGVQAGKMKRTRAG